MIKVRNWIASIPEEEKHIAYVGEGKTEQREFLLCGDGWEAYQDYSFHLDMLFDLEGATLHNQKEVEQTTVNSTKRTEEAVINTEETTTKETYTVLSKKMPDYEETDITPLRKSVKEDGIHLIWTVLCQHTQLRGKLRATIRAMGKDATEVKKSAIMVFEVDDSVKASPAVIPPVSELEQIMTEVDSQRRQADTAAMMALNSSETSVMASDFAMRYMREAEEAGQSAVTAATNATQAMTEASNAAITAVDQAKRAEHFHTQATAAAKTAVTAAEEATHAAAGAANILTGAQMTQSAIEQTADRVEKAAQACQSVAVHDDGNGNVAIIVADAKDTQDTPLIPHTLSGTVVTVDAKDAVGLPLKIAANDGATTVFVGGNNLLPTEDGTVMIESTYKRVYFPMTMPAGTYRIGAIVTSDVPNCDRVTVQLYHGTTYTSAGFSISANTGNRNGTAITAEAPFDNIALFSGHGAQASSGYGATYRDLAMTHHSEQLPNYEPYRGQAHTLPVNDMVLTAVPTVIMADQGDVSVTYYTDMPPASDGPIIHGGALESLTVNGRQYVLETDHTEVDTKKWSDKTWACLGDSLTQKMQHSDRYYHEYVSAETGISVVNMGIGGSGYKKREGENLAFYQRIGNVPATTDVVTIFGSGNDVASFSNLNPTAEDFVAYLGTETDSGTDTLCGCINTTIDRMYAKYPTMRLGLVSPTPWQHNEPTLTCTLAAYSEKLRAICHRRGIPFLDLFHLSGFRPGDATYRSLVFSGDGDAGVHPNALGHALIAPRFRAFLETLL